MIFAAYIFALVARPQGMLTASVKVLPKRVAVSPQLFGAFFEEVNHAGEGGLHAELVQNRTFADVDESGLPRFWKQSSPAKVKKQEIANHTYATLEIPAHGYIENSGYWGIPAYKKTRLNVAMSANCEDSLKISLRKPNGESIGGATLTPGTDWQLGGVPFSAKEEVPNASVRIENLSDKPAEIRYFSLTPADAAEDTFRGDLFSLVHEMRPGFIRFPGGCYVEGNNIVNAFRWKTALYAGMEREGHVNDNWGYWSTDGLGLYEYLVLCERTGAKPMFVTNCGISHHQVVPMDELQPWVDDALDALEFANGSENTQWGAVRAGMGHPAPFHMNLIEIGNENGLWDGFGGTNPQYTERYHVFYDAIKAKYPDVVCIANAKVDRDTDVIDEHYYNAPSFFWTNQNRYDSYPRTGPKIYVGEYAVTQDCGTGNLKAALAEAAFMTGMERNGDIVRMSSYAPLFVRVEDRHWNPDAIVFNGSQSYGTPSYYVQKLFANNRVDEAYSAKVEAAPDPNPVGAGVGVGTWKTQAEYEHLSLRTNNQNILLKDGARTGAWKVEGDALAQSDTQENRTALYLSTKPAGDSTIRVRARKTGGDEGFLLLFRVKDSKNFMWWNVGGWGNHQNALEKTVNGSKFEVGQQVPYSVENNRWYDLRVETKGNHISCYIDNKLVQEGDDTSPTSFAANIGRVKKSGDVIVKLVNGSESARKVTLDLRGMKVGPTATFTILTSAGLEDENSFAQPKRIAPGTSKRSGVSAYFDQICPPRSLVILRIKGK